MFLFILSILLVLAGLVASVASVWLQKLGRLGEPDPKATPLGRDGKRLLLVASPVLLFISFLLLEWLADRVPALDGDLMGLRSAKVGLPLGAVAVGLGLLILAGRPHSREVLGNLLVSLVLFLSCCNEAAVILNARLDPGAPSSHACRILRTYLRSPGAGDGIPRTSGCRPTSTTWAGRRTGAPWRW
jgi:hypothetical protein